MANSMAADSAIGGNSFAEYIHQERTRLAAEREAVNDRLRQIEARLGEIDDELRAIDAFEAARLRDDPNRAVVLRTRQAGRRGERQARLLSLIRSANGGLSRAEIIDGMGARGDDGAAGSIDNLLSLLVKRNELRRENGRYYG